MSQWKCKTDDGELGPLSFQQLADLVREGKLKEGALVRRAEASNWEPAWHVPGLLRAAGIVEPGDSIQNPKSQIQNVPPAHPAERHGGRSLQSSRRITLGDLVRAIVAAAIGVLAVGFFYRWASQAMTAFPMPPTIVDGETIDCYFPMVGRCTMLECGLFVRRCVRGGRRGDVARGREAGRFRRARLNGGWARQGLQIANRKLQIAK